MEEHLDNICNPGVIHIYLPYFDLFEIASLLAIKQTYETEPFDLKNQDKGRLVISIFYLIEECGLPKGLRSRASSVKN